MARRKSTPAPLGNEVSVDGGRSNRTILLMAALDMSWRLAIAVLVPIIAGFELDKHFNIAPTLTIIGFILAMAGVFFIMKRTLDVANSKYKAGVKR